MDDRPPTAGVRVLQRESVEEEFMAPINKQVRKLCGYLGGAALLVLGLAPVGAGSARAEAAAAATAAPAKADSKAAPKDEAKAPAATGEKRPVKENVKQLGNEISDPTTLQRIKAHEQALEKRIESRRERQRRDHGTARPSDAVDLAKSLDKPEDAAAPTPAKVETRNAAKPKNEAAPAPAPAPKPAPAPSPTQK
jgi:hypothetical protein